MSKKILITGASAGFGQLTVMSLLAKGHKVVASMRDPNGRNKDIAALLKKEGAHIVEIDVTQEQSVNSGVLQSINLLGGLDVLINNAGVGVVGWQEAYTAEDMQKLFDINVFGVQRMNRAVIPHFKAQTKGLLLHVSSLLGRITIPFYGPYNASKWALEALAENYRSELSQFGIESALVEPGGFPTTFIDRLLEPSDKKRVESYGELAHAPKAALDNFEQVLSQNPQQNPQLVADAMVQIIDTAHGQRPFRTTVDAIGMAEGIAPYNAHLEELTRTIYQNFGTDGLLTVKQA